MSEKILKDFEEYLKKLIDNFKPDVSDCIYHEQIAVELIYEYLQMLKEKYGEKND